MKQTIATALTITLLLLAASASAQTREGRFSLGLGANIGVTSAGLKSDHAAIASMTVAQEGGSLVLTAGTPAVRVKAMGGFFYSASKVPQTVDLVRIGTQLEFHPLSCIQKDYVRFSPYLIGGVIRNHHKFYGLYGSSGEDQPQNYSISEEPYLGAVTSLETMAGAGIALQLRSVSGQFLHLYAEYKAGFAFSRDASGMYQNTFFDDNQMVNIGVTFGRLF